MAAYTNVSIGPGARAHLGDHHETNITNGELSEAHEVVIKQKTSVLMVLVHAKEVKDDPLERLPFAEDAPFNAWVRRNDPTCLSDTRAGVLEEIYEWADGQDDRCIFWLNGLAGTGKSTISRTVAREYSSESSKQERRDRLGASFFFSRDAGGDVINGRKFFTTIAVELARNVPQLRSYISDAVKNNPQIGSQFPGEQWRQLIFHPFLELNKGSPPSSPPSSYILVVDALDEYGDKTSIWTIIQLLTEAQSLKTV